MSSVTHELRTPLTSIRALSELMLDTPDMEAGQREEFLRIVVSESERLSRLVNQVLDMAKIESGHAEWHNADVDMRALVANAVRADVRAVPRARRGGRAVLARPGAADPRRPRPADPGHAEPALQRREVRSGRGRAGSRSCCAPTGTASSSRSATTAPACRRREQATVFEKFRQGGDAADPAAGDGARASDQPPDRRSFRRAHVAGIGAGRGRVLRVPAAAAAGGRKRHEGPDRRRRAEHRRLARVHDEARGLRGAGGARRPGRRWRRSAASGRGWCCSTR